MNRYRKHEEKLGMSQIWLCLLMRDYEKEKKHTKTYNRELWTDNKGSKDAE